VIGAVISRIGEARTIASLVSATAIVAPWLMTELFGYFSSDRAPFYFPGMPFLTASLLMVLATLRFAWTARNGRLASVPADAAG